MLQNAEPCLLLDVYEHFESLPPPSSSLSSSSSQSTANTAHDFLMAMFSHWVPPAAEKRAVVVDPVVLKKSPQEKVQVAAPAADYHHHTCSDSGVEEDGGGGGGGGGGDDELGAEFRHWLHKTLRLHFTTELVWPMPPIEVDDDEEEEEEIEAEKEEEKEPELKEEQKVGVQQNQQPPPLSSPFETLLVDVLDPLASHQPKSSTPNPWTSDQPLPLPSPGLSSFSDPEFCQLFEVPKSQHQQQQKQQQPQPVNPPLQQKDDEDDEEEKDKEEEEEEEDFDDNASFITAHDFDEEEEIAEEGFEETHSHFEPDPVAPKQYKLSAVAAPSSSSSEDLDPQQSSSTNNFRSSSSSASSEMDSEVDSEEKMRGKYYQSDDEEEEETEDPSFLTTSSKRHNTDEEELFEPFDLSSTSFASADSNPANTTGTGGNTSSSDVWKDDRDNEKVLSDLDLISSGHNPAAIDQAALDPATACIFCPSVDHCSASCSAYASVVERIYRAVHEQRRCVVCLQLEADHGKKDCPQRTVTACRQCGLAHAEMLFHERPPPEDEEESEGKKGEDKNGG